MSDCRSEAGRLFQILGPATEKLLSPSRVFVLGTVSYVQNVRLAQTCIETCSWAEVEERPTAALIACAV